MKLLNLSSRSLFILGMATYITTQISGCSSPIKYTPSNSHQGVSERPNIYGADGFCTEIYVVKSGDTLSAIADSCGVTVKQIQQLNHLDSANLIYVNQELLIPNARPEESNEPVIPTVTKVPQPQQMQAEAKSNTTVAPRAISKSNWAWPMSKKTNHRFIRDNNGISALEVYGFVGQKVFAMSGGEVVFAGDGITEYGNMIMIKHPDGKLSVYAHNQKLLVKKGQQVKKGQVIATMGSTGLTNRPKLYTEVRYHGRKISIKNILEN